MRQPFTFSVSSELFVSSIQSGKSPSSSHSVARFFIIISVMRSFPFISEAGEGVLSGFGSSVSAGAAAFRAVRGTAVEAGITTAGRTASAVDRAEGAGALIAVGSAVAAGASVAVLAGAGACTGWRVRRSQKAVKAATVTSTAVRKMMRKRSPLCMGDLPKRK